jgi:hypothetical protein
MRSNQYLQNDPEGGGRSASDTFVSTTSSVAESFFSKSWTAEFARCVYGRAPFPVKQVIQCNPAVESIVKRYEGILEESGYRGATKEKLAHEIVAAVYTRIFVCDLALAVDLGAIDTLYSGKALKSQNFIQMIDSIGYHAHTQLYRREIKAQCNKRISAKQLNTQLGTLGDDVLLRQEALEMYQSGNPSASTMGKRIPEKAIKQIVAMEPVGAFDPALDIAMLVEARSDVAALGEGEDTFQLHVHKALSVANAIAGAEGVLWMCSQLEKVCQTEMGLPDYSMAQMYLEHTDEFITIARKVCEDTCADLGERAAALEKVAKCNGTIPMVEFAQIEHASAVGGPGLSVTLLGVEEIERFGEFVAGHPARGQNALQQVVESNLRAAVSFMRTASEYPVGTITRLIESLRCKVSDGEVAYSIAKKITEASKYAFTESQTLLDAMLGVQLAIDRKIVGHSLQVRSIAEYLGREDSWTAEEAAGFCRSALAKVRDVHAAKPSARSPVFNAQPSTTSIQSTDRAKSLAESAGVADQVTPESLVSVDADPPMRSWQSRLLTIGIAKEEMMSLMSELSRAGIRATCLRDLHLSKPWQFREFAIQVKEHGACEYFRRILNTPTLFRKYTHDLTVSPKDVVRLLKDLAQANPETQQVLIDRWLGDGVGISNANPSELGVSSANERAGQSPQQAIDEYRRIYIYGGKVNGDKLSILRNRYPHLEIIHSHVDSRLSGKEFTISENDLVLWCTDYNSHHGHNDISRLKQHCAGIGAEFMYLTRSSHSALANIFEVQ